MVLNRKEWIHTKKGERKEDMLIKGIALSVSWDTMKKLSGRKRIDQFPSMIVKIKNELRDNGVKSDDNTITTFLCCIYQDPDRFRMMKCIDDYATEKKKYETGGHHLRFIREKDVCDAVIDYINNNDNVTSTSYVNRLIYSVHSAFYFIGREYEWGERKGIKLASDHETVFINGGNPLSKSSLETIRKRFINDIKPDRLSKIQIKDNNGEDKEWNKHSKPGSIAVVFHVMSTIFANILKSIKPNNGLNAMEPVDNWLNVLMLYYFLIHEGGRPGDTIGWRTNGDIPEPKNCSTPKSAILNERGQQHRKMMFSFNGKNFYVLVLAFVKPTTLAYFLGEGQLKRYVCWFWKGKGAGKKGSGGEYRGRVKSWMPPAYNMLDLATMYVILMRIKLVIAPETVGLHIFKQGQHVARHMKANTQPLPEKRRHKQNLFSVNVEGLTPYSIRYAAAEEERSLGMDARLTRSRMGHTCVSEMASWYADNLYQRMSIFDKDTKYTVKLGCDIYQPYHKSESIPLLTVSLYDTNDMPDNSVDSNLSKDMIDELMDELNTKNELIKPIVLRNKTLEEVPQLKRYIPNDRQALCKELSVIPLGMHFKFGDGLLSENTMNELNERLEYIGGCFETVEVPNNPQKVWTFPQVMWGEWNQELKKQVANTQIRRAKRGLADLACKIYEECKDLSDDEDEDNSDDEVEDNSDEDEDNSDEEEEISPQTYMRFRLRDERSSKRLAIDYKESKWQGRMIAVICDIPGESPLYEFSIPGTDYYVWIGRVQSFKRLSTNKLAFKVKAVWYKGHGDITTEMRPGEDNGCVKSPPEGLIHWWRPSKTQQTKFRVPEGDISKMIGHLNTYWKPE